MPKILPGHWSKAAGARTVDILGSEFLFFPLVTYDVIESPANSTKGLRFIGWHDLVAEMQTLCVPAGTNHHYMVKSYLKKGRTNFTMGRKKSLKNDSRHWLSFSLSFKKNEVDMAATSGGPIGPS